jgi:murein DD-endopeptidase MepM/ murein hydrolase activator NlpD
VSRARRARGRGRAAWLTLVLPVLVFAGAASPAIAQRVPSFLFPALAVAGAVLITVSLGRSVVRVARGGPVRVLPLLLTAAAMLLFVVLPAVQLVRTRGAGDGAPRLLTRFGSWQGAEGYPRLDAHRGIDVAAIPGDDVLAAADGRVLVARDNRDLCGLIVVVDHPPHGYQTVYCHFATLAVRAGDAVARGQRLGTVGTSGQRAWPGYEHVHLELQRGRNRDDLEDPRPRLVGCFDPAAAYPTDRLVLTHPVQCGRRAGR